VDWAGNVSPYVTAGVTTWLTALNSPSPTLEGHFGAVGHGDVNGDGVEDLLVGGSVEQRVYVYSGADGALLRTIHAPNPAAFPDSTGFGGTLAVGDTNGDGYGDVIVGAPIEDRDPLPPNGRAYVFSGADGSLMRSFSSPNASPAYFGGSVASGDVNGDTYADVIVGGGWENQIHVFSGVDGALLYTIEGDEPDTNFGGLVVTGDVNNDGHTDIATVATGADGKRGRAYVYSGATAELLYSFSSPSQQSSYWGMPQDLALGDVNGDGFADVAVGHAEEDVEQQDRGRVYVYSGATGQTILTLDAPEPWPYVRFGEVIVIRDGAIFVGSLIQGTLELKDGAVWVFDYDGTPTGVVRRPSPPYTFTGFGSFITVFNTKLAISAVNYTGSGPSMQGRAYLTDIADIPTLP
jgi:hypothetical protein